MGTGADHAVHAIVGKWVENPRVYDSHDLFPKDEVRHPRLKTAWRTARINQ